MEIEAWLILEYVSTKLMGEYLGLGGRKWVYRRAFRFHARPVVGDLVNIGGRAVKITAVQHSEWGLEVFLDRMCYIEYHKNDDPEEAFNSDGPDRKWLSEAGFERELVEG
jgi:hypothetical protein